MLSAVKVLMKLMDQIANTEFVQMLQKKLAPPLVTLLSAEAEIQVNVYDDHASIELSREIALLSSFDKLKLYHLQNV